VRLEYISKQIYHRKMTSQKAIR